MNIGLIDVDGGKGITLDEALSKASPVLRRKMEHTRDVVLKALPLARMATDNEEYKLKRWFQWTLLIFFVLFVLGAISTVAFGILAIWV